jgi:predicted dinucleotide-binding enzyme
MKITVIGAGNVGGAVARGTRAAGHEVTLTDAGSGKARAVATEIGATATDDLTAAVAAADVVVLAVPYQALSTLADRLRVALDGKIVVDATNPIAPDFSGLAVSGRSGAEEVQAQLEGARVVKAFNTVFAANQSTGRVENNQLDGFYASDDPDAKATVAQILSGVGFRPVDAGPLRAALALEHMAFLNISLNASRGWPWQSGWKLLGPTA